MRYMGESILRSKSVLDQISALILTFNEEANIRRTLEALTRIQEVIVLDSFSTDQTKVIATQFPNVRFFERVFDQYSNQWNYGHTLTENDWILSLDADYQISDDFLDEISSLDLGCHGYIAAFRYGIKGHPLRSAILPPRIIYYNKKKCQYIQDGHTQRLLIPGKIGKLKTPVYHDDRKSLDRWLRSQLGYSDLEMQKLFNPEQKISGVDSIRKKTWISPFLVFFYTLFIKGALWEGRNGIYYAYQRMYAELLLLLKVLDHKIMESDHHQDEVQSLNRNKQTDLR